MVAVHQVPASKIADYEAWLVDSGRIEMGFSGFMSREVTKPVAGGQDFYTLVVRFDSSDSLGQWLDSSDWKGLHACLQSLVDSTDRYGTDERYLTPFWYRPDPYAVPAPTWKIWLSTVLALYPAIFIISLLLGGVTLPFAAIGHWRDGRRIDYEGSYGFAHDYITHGFLRASQRRVDEVKSSEGAPVLSHSSSEPLAVGEQVRLRVPMHASSTSLRAGDELRVELHSSWMWPHNAATGQFPARYVTLRNPAPITIYAGSDAGSALVVPMRA